MHIHVQMAHSAPIAVVSAEYSGKRSRILLWHTDTDTFQPGQWLKGRIQLLDLSPDGRYLGYYVETFHRPVQSYIAISRPPYLTALFFLPCFHLNNLDLSFGRDNTLQWFAGEPFGRQTEQFPELYTPRLEPGYPFEIVPYRGVSVREERERDETRMGFAEAIARYGELARDVILYPNLASQIFPSAVGHNFQTAVAWDHRSRLILGQDERLIAFSPEHPEGQLLLDLTDRTFREMPTPDWARTWTDAPDAKHPIPST